MFVFHNEYWAVEDNLVGGHEEEHKLHNAGFYSLLARHPQSTVCKTAATLAAKFEQLTAKYEAYMCSPNDTKWKGNHIELIIVESMKDIPLPPPMFGNLDAIKDSDEMSVFKQVLAHFSKDTKELIPIYGCSAFEYIQYLDTFLAEASELSKKYEYCCAKTDIQAAQLCGFDQPEGKCIMMINDVYGIHALGESLRATMQKVGKHQLIIFIWHPMLEGVMDLFTVHRPQLVWPSVGPHYAKYFVNNEKDFMSWELCGNDASEVMAALDRGTKLTVINMIPEHERNFISMDTRVSICPKKREF